MLKVSGVLPMDDRIPVPSCSRMERHTPVMRQLNRSTSRLWLLGALCAVAALFPSAAQAACPNQATRQVFGLFGDFNWYFAAPGGTFEPGTAAWTLSGASLTPGNETYFVNSSSDRQSLKVPAGASALSPSLCVGAEHPTLRLMARKLSGFNGVLRVDLLYSGGTRLAGTVVNSGQYLAWRPTQPLDLAAALSLTGTTTTVSVRIRVTADNAGSWGVDDVFIDPYRR
jgi:hypothetical protein